MHKAIITKSHSDFSLMIMIGAYTRGYSVEQYAFSEVIIQECICIYVDRMYICI